jgi:hypothetical protein
MARYFIVDNSYTTPQNNLHKAAQAWFAEQHCRVLEDFAEYENFKLEAANTIDKLSREHPRCTPLRLSSHQGRRGEAHLVMYTTHCRMSVYREKV